MENVYKREEKKRDFYWAENRRRIDTPIHLKCWKHSFTLTHL